MPISRISTTWNCYSALNQSPPAAAQRWRSLLAGRRFPDLAADIQADRSRLCDDGISSDGLSTGPTSLSVYDASFLALALKHDALLITAGKQLAKAAASLGCLADAELRSIR